MDLRLLERTLQTSVGLFLPKQASSEVKERITRLISLLIKAQDHPRFLQEMMPAFEKFEEIAARLSEELEAKAGD